MGRRSTMAFLTSAEQASLDIAIRKAEQACRSEISVYLGQTEGDPRDFATSLHNTLVAPARSVLVMVDQERRLIEVVTGGHVRRTLTDDEAADVVSTMSAKFSAGEIAEGLVEGVTLIGKHALD